MFDRFRGVLPKSVGEGTHFLVPFIETHHRHRTSEVHHLGDGHEGPATGEPHVARAAPPDVARLPEIHTNLGPEYEERVLPSIGNEVLKATVARFNADQPSPCLRGEQEGAALRKRAEDFGLCWRMSR